MTGRAPALRQALTGPLILASASPRRQEILRLAGVPFEVRASVSEPAALPGRRPAEQAVKMARSKALEGAPHCPGRLVVGADTIVALGRQALEKPADAEQARRMLRLLSGRQHAVYTGLVIVLGGEAEVLGEACEQSLVTFRRLSAEEIERYVASGDPLDKAGAYGIQSGGGELVAEVLGSYLNVVGLPLAKLAGMLAGLGWAAGEGS